jgi:hypothetical protein
VYMHAFMHVSYVTARAFARVCALDAHANTDASAYVRSLDYCPVANISCERIIHPQTQPHKCAHVCIRIQIMHIDRT